MPYWIADFFQQCLDFSNVMNASIAAGWMILAVLLLRLLLKKAPKSTHVVLWGLVAVRLLLPFSMESALSLIPSKNTIPQEILHYEGKLLQEPAHLEVVNNPVYPDALTLELSQSVDRIQIKEMYMTFWWIDGIGVMLLYITIGYLCLRRRVRTAVLYRDNLFQSEYVNSPFVLGMISPRIYLPFQMEEHSLEYVIAHEQAHIRRRDHWWKPLGFLLLTIHWFNPLMWLAYILLCRDIELACDEKVIKVLDHAHRADYSQALLSCHISRRRTIAACPLAFGEVGVKKRVQHVLSYKKPTFWGVISGIAAVVILGLCFLTNPPEEENGKHRMTLEDFVLSEAQINLGKGVGYRFQVVIAEGEYYTVEDVEPGGGIYNENYKGNCELRVLDPKDKVLDKANLGAYNYPGKFQLRISDYNKDGYPDVTLGNYGSFNWNMFELYTIDHQGKIRNICEDSIVVGVKDHSVFLTQTEEGNTDFYTSAWNNITGQMETIRWVWDQEKGIYRKR